MKLRLKHHFLQHQEQKIVVTEIVPLNKGHLGRVLHLTAGHPLLHFI